MQEISILNQFLGCKTPCQWVDHAIQRQDLLLIDHANCEKKAAMAALHLIHQYPEHDELLQKMARLAREEILHLQKVRLIMSKRNIKYKRISASRYAEKLRAEARNHEPAKLVDILIIGAFIEARSCERFAVIAPYLDDELQHFYRSLLRSEARHFQDYLNLAKQYSLEDIEPRVTYFKAVEAQLITDEDDIFRFHSGRPSANISASRLERV